MGGSRWIEAKKERAETASMGARTWMTRDSKVLNIAEIYKGQEYVERHDSPHPEQIQSTNENKSSLSVVSTSEKVQLPDKFYFSVLIFDRDKS